MPPRTGAALQGLQSSNPVLVQQNVKKRADGFMKSWREHVLVLADHNLWLFRAKDSVEQGNEKLRVNVDDCLVMANPNQKKNEALLDISYPGSDTDPGHLTLMLESQADSQEWINFVEKSRAWMRESRRQKQQATTNARPMVDSDTKSLSVSAAQQEADQQTPSSSSQPAISVDVPDSPRTPQALQSQGTESIQTPASTDAPNDNRLTSSGPSSAAGDSPFRRAKREKKSRSSISSPSGSSTIEFPSEYPDAGGIGLVLASGGDGSISIDKIVNGSARRCSVQATAKKHESGALAVGDIILSINGKDVSGFGSSDCRDLIVGPTGSLVQLTVKKPDCQDSFTVDLIRVPTTMWLDDYAVRVAAIREAAKAKDDARVLTELNSQLESKLKEIQSDDLGSKSAGSDLEQKYDSLLAEVESLQSKEKSAESEKQRLMTQLSEVESSSSLSERKLTAQAGLISKLKSKVKELENGSAVSSLEAELDKLKAENAELKKAALLPGQSTNQPSQQLESLQKENHELQKTLRDLDEAVAAAEASLDVANKSLAQRDLLHSDAMAAIERSHKEEIEQLQLRIDSMSKIQQSPEVTQEATTPDFARKSTAESGETEINQEMASRQKACDESDEKHKNLSEENQRLKAQIQSLQSQVDGASTEETNLKQRCLDMEQSIQETAVKLETQLKEIEAQNETNHKLEGRLTESLGHLQEAKGETSSLKEQNDNLRSELDAMQKALQTIPATGQMETKALYERIASIEKENEESERQCNTLKQLLKEKTEELAETIAKGKQHLMLQLSPRDEQVPKQVIHSPSNSMQLMQEELMEAGAKILCLEQEIKTKDNLLKTLETKLEKEQLLKKALAEDLKDHKMLWTGMIQQTTAISSDKFQTSQSLDASFSSLPDEIDSHDLFEIPEDVSGAEAWFSVFDDCKSKAISRISALESGLDACKKKNASIRAQAIIEQEALAGLLSHAEVKLQRAVDENSELAPLVSQTKDEIDALREENEKLRGENDLSKRRLAGLEAESKALKIICDNIPGSGSTDTVPVNGVVWQKVLDRRDDTIMRLSQEKWALEVQVANALERSSSTAADNRTLKQQLLDVNNEKAKVDKSLDHVRQRLKQALQELDDKEVEISSLNANVRAMELETQRILGRASGLETMRKSREVSQVEGLTTENESLSVSLQREVEEGLQKELLWQADKAQLQSRILHLEEKLNSESHRALESMHVLKWKTQYESAQARLKEAEARLTIAESSALASTNPTLSRSVTNSPSSTMTSSDNLLIADLKRQIKKLKETNFQHADPSNNQTVAELKSKLIKAERDAQDWQRQAERYEKQAKALLSHFPALSSSINP